jgi:cysteine sulfinate desulfinase/cysteine desulfurase-like protein
VNKVASAIQLRFDIHASSLPIDVKEWGAAMVSFSPHRFYGPKGVGVLYRNRKARIVSMIHGGVQEGGRRAGTENIPAIVGGGVAAEIAQERLTQRVAHVAPLQKRLWEGLKLNVPYIQLNGSEPGPDRIATNLNLSTEFIEGEGPVVALRYERNRRGEWVELREQESQSVPCPGSHWLGSRSGPREHHYDSWRGQYRSRH